MNQDNQPPLVLVDLDDTIFQTHRRIEPEANFKIMTTDKQGQALSFANPVQQHFIQWLLQSTHVIPVTARCVEALSRVHLPFAHGAVCSHGATILNADNTVNQLWHRQMMAELAAYQTRQQQLMQVLQQQADAFGSIRTWIVEEQGLGLYTVAKQNAFEQDGAFLPQLLQRLQQLEPELLQGFYCHINGNNLAIIPKPVSKANAVRFLLQQVDMTQRSVLGFGDSLSDVEFLSLCHWWGMPKNSQAHRWLNGQLQQNYQQQGYYGE